MVRSLQPRVQHAIAGPGARDVEGNSGHAGGGQYRMVYLAFEKRRRCQPTIAALSETEQMPSAFVRTFEVQEIDHRRGAARVLVS